MSAPFGIPIFESKDALDIQSELPGEKYSVVAPRPHPSFQDYYVQASDNLGVVWVKAIGPSEAVDAYGNALRVNVDRVAEQVGRKYGTPEKTDVLLPGAMWDEPQYWMNALEDGQRFYSYTWKRPRNELDDDLETVFVGASSFGGGQGGVIIEYASTKLANHEHELEGKLSELF